MKQLNNTINKAFILNNIAQIDIFARYFNIEVNVIQHCINTGTLIKSPIRVDKHNSVGFKYNSKNMLKMRDFGGYFWGDCFDAVAYILSAKGNRINVNKKDGFKLVLEHIAIEFGIINGIKTDNLVVLVNNVQHGKHIITFEPRSWNSNDKRYWIYKYYHLFDTTFLSSKYVYPVERYWIDSYSQPEPKYYATTKDPCYAYYLGTDDNNISNIQLYFPKRDKKSHNPKFITNSNAFSGIIDIQEKYDFIILTKSYKDVLALVRIIEHLFFTGNKTVLVLGYPSENYIMNDQLFAWLLNKLYIQDVGRILNFTDFDFTGRKCAMAAYEYGIPFTFLTNGMFGLVDQGAKDITDFIENFGISATITLIKEYINTKLHEYNEEDFNNEIYGNETYAPF